MLNVLYFVFLLFKGYDILNIYQQAHYQIKPYLRHFLLNIVYSVILPLFFFVFVVIINNIWVYTVGFLYLVVYCYLLFLLPKKRLVFSKRIIKLSILYLLLISLVFISNKYFLFIYILFEYLLVPFLYLDIFISYINNLKYINLAKEKLKDFKGKIIGITGSAGKTSTKWILYNILKEFYNVITPDKSFNTLLGISSFINNNSIDVDFIILEYGISNKKDMDELLSLCIPDIAILTSILPMHIDGLKNINNVIYEKDKLISSAKIKIVNFDNQYIKEYYGSKSVISYGVYDGDNKIEIIDSYQNKFSMFGFCFETGLVGREQILNTGAALCVCKYLGLNLEHVKRVLELVNNYEHRLEIKGVNHKIIDDAYNSNIIGFEMALEVLSKQKGFKILLTPGIVELGKYEKEVYLKIKDSIISSCDCVILIGGGTRRLKYLLKDYLIEVYTVHSFKEGYMLASKIRKEYTESCLLIENDLPDLYKIGFRI